MALANIWSINVVKLDSSCLKPRSNNENNNNDIENW